MKKSLILSLLPLFLIINVGVSNNITSLNRHNLKSYIMDHLTTTIIPKNNDRPIYLNLSIAIRAFNNIDQIDGSITMNIWLRYEWHDHLIKWDPEKWSNVTSISLDTNPDMDSYIWTPDIFLYNTAEKPMDQLFYTKAKVHSNGRIFWSRPGLIKSTCTFDMTHYPFDQQICYLKFGSWSYDSSEIYLDYDKTNGIDISNYQKHEEWSLVDQYIKKNSINYPCCEHDFHDLQFFYVLRRRPGYYNLNIIIPTFATSILIIMSLLIPLKSGERISFAVTILLSIIVFLLIVSDNLPKSDAEPLLSRMIIGLIYYSLFVLIFTIIIGYLHNYIEELKENNTEKNRIIEFLLSLCRFSKCCKKPNTNTTRRIVRSDSYNDVINALETSTNNISVIGNNRGSNPNNKTIEDIEDCIYLIYYIEKLFIFIFFISFVIYCSVMFSYIPTY